ncbi:unnamed protein product [Pocillopora meandrina]|uniref:Uncharacterized protein n=1 Tax=Pocillopora meandrina TaxID=46732 RepID=A0AAU9VQ93_9CNID|nr:unnamed protein product [Pocillopora meandrina]
MARVKFLSSGLKVLKKMSLSFIDPELDRKLNDIDEFIMEQSGNDVAVEYNNTNRILTAQIREASLEVLTVPVEHVCSTLFQGS